MNTTKYEQLKQVIQQANPEIMELKFGCEIQEKSESGNLWEVWTILSEGEERFKVFDIKDGSYDFFHSDYVNDDNTIKILGRPIGIADVLLAMLNEPKCDFWAIDSVKLP